MECRYRIVTTGLTLPAARTAFGGRTPRTGARPHRHLDGAIYNPDRVVQMCVFDPMHQVRAISGHTSRSLSNLADLLRGDKRVRAGVRLAQAVIMRGVVHAGLDEVSRVTIRCSQLDHVLGLAIKRIVGISIADLLYAEPTKDMTSVLRITRQADRLIRRIAFATGTRRFNAAAQLVKS